MTIVDNIIIGAGPAGYELAAGLAERGESVVIIERDRLGGTCLNRGCIPTKALCASANAVNEVRFASVLGIEVENIYVDYDKINLRAREVVDGLRTGVESLLGKCRIIHGEAVFTGSKTIRVGEEYFEAKRIVIASGSRPAKLNIPGSEFALTSDEALWLDKLPDSMVVIGGGVIGMEFASIFASLGSKVTVVEYCKEILPTIDADIAKRLRTHLSRHGIDIYTGAAVERIEKEDAKVKVIYNGKKGNATVDADVVVMAVGRLPVIPPGFEGRLTSRGFIEVDDNMRTSIDGVYAVGDVNGLLMLAHAAYAQGRVVLHDEPTLFNSYLVPSVVFTSPEVASVGMKAADLDEAGIKYQVVKRSFASNGKACAEGHADGLLKMLVLDDDNTIVSVTVYGHHAADLIAEATMLVTDRVRYDEVGCKYIHAHPTLSEIFV